MDDTRKAALVALLQHLDPPPLYVDGVVHFPEGDVEMSPQEYLAHFGRCHHELRAGILVALLAKAYDNIPDGWMGWGSRRIMAPFMDALAFLYPEVEQMQGVKWE